MENWPIYVVLLIVHVLMFTSVSVSIYDCKIRTLSKKLILYFLAIVFPILGPVFVHYRLLNFVKPKGDSFHSNIASPYYANDSSTNSSSVGFDSSSGD